MCGLNSTRYSITEEEIYHNEYLALPSVNNGTLDQCVSHCLDSSEQCIAIDYRNSSCTAFLHSDSGFYDYASYGGIEMQFYCLQGKITKTCVTESFVSQSNTSRKAL